jgi:hypothetical protein
VVIFICSGLFVFRSRHKHLLLTLLRLEYVILNIFILLAIDLNLERRESYNLLVFLIFVVVEGRAGLSLLISVVRSHGRDHLKSFNLLW